jgi:hypothetical protein
MKTEKEKKEKSTIEELREIRDKISIEIQDMSFEELQKYIEKKLTLHPKNKWVKGN